MEWHQHHCGESSQIKTKTEIDKGKILHINRETTTIKAIKTIDNHIMIEEDIKGITKETGEEDVEGGNKEEEEEIEVGEEAEDIIMIIREGSNRVILEIAIMETDNQMIIEVTIEIRQATIRRTGDNMEGNRP